jgi:hypothetical protein
MAREKLPQVNASAVSAGSMSASHSQPGQLSGVTCIYTCLHAACLVGCAAFGEVSGASAGSESQTTSVVFSVRLTKQPRLSPSVAAGRRHPYSRFGCRAKAGGLARSRITQPGRHWWTQDATGGGEAGNGDGGSGGG